MPNLLPVVSALAAELRAAGDEALVARAVVAAVARIQPDRAARFSVTRGETTTRLAGHGDEEALDATTALPLAADGERFGLLAVDVRAASAPEVQALSLVADLAAGALARIRLRARMEGEAAADFERQRRALEESEARARRLQDSGVIGVVLWTRDGAIVDANDAFLRMVGYTREELARGDLVWRQMTPPEFAEADERAFAEMDRQGFCRPYEKEYLHKDGHRVPISLGVAFWENTRTSGVAWIVDISERKSLERQREEALAQLEKHRRLLQALVDHAPASIFMKDLEGRHILVNRAAAAVAGRAPDEVIGKTDHELVSSALADRFRRDDLRAAASPTPIEVQDDWTVGSEHRVGHTIKFAVRDADGVVYATGGVSVDVTERLALEQAERRASEALVLQAHVLESVAEGICVVDADGSIVYANAALDEMLGYARGELVGRRAGLISPMSRVRDEHLVADVTRHLEQHALWSGEWQARKKDGTPITTRARISAIDRPTGKLYVCVQEDVTEDRRTQQATAFLSKVGGALAGALDQDTILERITELVVPERASWCAVFLAGARDELGLAAFVHVDLAKREALRRWVVDVAASPDGPQSVLETRAAKLVDRGLLAVPLLVHWRRTGLLLLGTEAPAGFEDGEVRVAEELGRRLAMLLDNAQLYAESQQERRRAEEASRAKDELLSVTSHELRTPLNAILGWVRMLRTGGVPPEKRDSALERIERNARLQVQLVDDILDVSRVITGKLRLDVGVVEPLRVLEQALEVIRPAAEAKGVRVHVHETPNDLGTIRGDAARIQQVLWNLLANAVKFTPRGGDVEVSVARDASHVTFVVKDTGQGIAPAFLPHAFEPFRQEDGSITRVHGGLGLGLAIVKHLVELHGGNVEATSDGVGHGTRFEVVLPVSSATEAGAILPASSSQGRGASTPAEHVRDLESVRVLVVDDEVDARDLVETILLACGARVSKAASAAEALTLFAREPYDVVVSDIGMSGESGLDLVRKVRALPRERGGTVPAIALSAYASAQDRSRALAAGFTAHLGKPMDARELVSIVSALVGRAARAPSS